MFVTFEGIEGCGKSTLLSSVATTLSKNGRDILTTREPGGTPVGDFVRSIFLDQSLSIEPICEALLANASRAQLVAAVIRPALQRREIVLCDRYCDSTVAYQGYGRGLETEMLMEMCKLATGGLMPDLTFLVDIPVEVSQERIHARVDRTGNRIDRLEREGSNFHLRVRNGYLQLARRFARIVVVDGCMPPQELVEMVMREVYARLVTV